MSWAIALGCGGDAAAGKPGDLVTRAVGGQGGAVDAGSVALEENTGVASAGVMVADDLISPQQARSVASGCEPAVLIEKRAGARGIDNGINAPGAVGMVTFGKQGDAERPRSDGGPYGGDQVFRPIAGIAIGNAAAAG